MTDRLDDEAAEIQREIERIDAGGDAWNEDDEVVEIEFKRPLDKVVPVRLASAHWYRLYHEAHELGVGPTTLARMWILEKLRTLPKRAAEASGAHAGSNGIAKPARRGAGSATKPGHRGAASRTGTRAASSRTQRSPAAAGSVKSAAPKASGRKPKK
jgi:hypothetical protein